MSALDSARIFSRTVSQRHPLRYIGSGSVSASSNQARLRIARNRPASPYFLQKYAKDRVSGMPCS